MKSLVECIFGLVRGFNDDEGVPEATYDATRDLIQCVLGERAVEHFVRAIDATDGRFYLKDKKTLEWTLRKLTEEL